MAARDARSGGCHRPGRHRCAARRRATGNAGSETVSEHTTRDATHTGRTHGHGTTIDCTGKTDPGRTSTRTDTNRTGKTDTDRTGKTDTDRTHARTHIEDRTGKADTDRTRKTDTDGARGGRGSAESRYPPAAGCSTEACGQLGGGIQ